MSEKPIFRPITEKETEQLKKLSKIVFLPAHPDKRFVNNMQGATQISHKQSDYLAKLIYKYRRQI